MSVTKLEIFVWDFLVKFQNKEERERVEQKPGTKEKFDAIGYETNGIILFIFIDLVLHAFWHFKWLIFFPGFICFCVFCSTNV